MVHKEDGLHEDATADEEPAAGTGLPPERPKGRPSLSRMRRELTDDELGSSGVAKILSDDVERLELEVGTLRDYERRFHESDKVSAVLKERLKKAAAVEIASSSALTTGGLLAGLAPTGWAHQPAGYALLGGGLVVVAIGVVVKAVSR